MLAELGGDLKGGVERIEDLDALLLAVTATHTPFRLAAFTMLASMSASPTDVPRPEAATASATLRSMSPETNITKDSPYTLWKSCCQRVRA